MQTRVVFLALATLAFSPGPSAQTISAKGSDTLRPLAERWSLAYARKNADAHLVVSGGGSGSGIAALLKGETDIAESSRALNASEKEQFKKQGKTPIDIVVGQDAVAILVNRDNSVSALTMEQVKGIFTGTISNWKELGGQDAKISLYGRERTSGTYTFLQEHALHGDAYSPGMTEFPANAAMIAAVLQDKNGICYAGLSSGQTLRRLQIRKEASSPGIDPSAQNVKSSAYPLCRQLHWYLAAKPAGTLKELCLWVLSPEGQAIAEKLGFVPLSSEARAAMSGRL